MSEEIGLDWQEQTLYLDLLICAQRICCLSLTMLNFVLHKWCVESGRTNSWYNEPWALSAGAGSGKCWQPLHCAATWNLSSALCAECPTEEQLFQRDGKAVWPVVLETLDKNANVKLYSKWEAPFSSAVYFLSGGNCYCCLIISQVKRQY